MKRKFKNIGLCALMAAGLSLTACNDLLDLEPVNQITPESYFGTVDQLGSYLNQYYDSYLSGMYHSGGWNDGLAASDQNTDIFIKGAGNQNTYSQGLWQVSAGKNLQGTFSTIRSCNYFINLVEEKMKAGIISGAEADIKSYLGEMYFFRALTNFGALRSFGDFPIVTKVLEDRKEELVAASIRAPRNEFARFILKDLDTAIGYLYDRTKFKGQRVNKETALLLKSRVALFEGSFEKYHKGSGRVPGDANWPGKDKPGNKGKNFNIDGEVSFFLTEAMAAAKQVADNANLTANSHQINPQVGQVYGWNAYFEMFSQPTLDNVGEVLLWKQYSREHNIITGTSYRVRIGCNDGFTRAFAESFLTKDGLPIYATGEAYQDSTLDLVKRNRDERLQLFMWGESDVLDTDPAAPAIQQGKKFGHPDITGSEVEKRCVTGYQPRKYYTYNYEQNINDENRTTNACPIFRTAEALLNYMEAAYIKNGALDETAKNYWRQLRTRAGVSTDFEQTIAKTDLTKEGEWSKYSGGQLVDKTLFNIRRERMNELFSEGQRYADLIRWRAFDQLIGKKVVVEGINFWDTYYNWYNNPKADGSGDAIVSKRELGKYLRPTSIVYTDNNKLKDGYTWTEAYYLTPIGALDISTASPDGSVENSNLYQNINWPSTAGIALK